jgi:hypothetical protein
MTTATTTFHHYKEVASPSLVCDYSRPCHQSEINVSSSNLDAVSSHLVQHIANTYLSPLERSFLSCCNKCLYNLLPPLLQISISSPCINELDHFPSNEGRLLDSGILRNVVKDVFVTPQDALEDENGDLFRLSLGKNCFHDCGYAEIIAPSVFALYDQTLKASERLVYGRRYYFWSFDYERSNFVFLGRHTRHAGKDDSRVEYSLAARPLLPNQSWEIIATNNDKHPGDVVQWGDNVGLTVAGDNPHPRRPDSMRRSLLSCLSNDDHHPYSTGTTNSLYIRDKWNWCFVQDNMKLGPNEILVLLPSTQYISTHVVTESKKLIVHAIPEACDEGEYQLYSPASLRYGQAACDGLHIKLNFEHWIEKGIMYEN